MTRPNVAVPGLGGKTAVVTGTAHGIGAAIAEALRGDGAVVYGVDRDAADLTSPGAVRQFFAGVGPVDILVNNAGGSDANALGSGLAERNDGGLTALGRRAVARMNKLGLAIDVSHSGDRTALDTCAQSDRPVFITHAGARAVWDTPRMKADDVLRGVAVTGGVIGMSAAPHTTLSAGHPRHSIESVMDHFRYCADLVGIDRVAFGPDTLYGDHVALHRIFAHLLAIGAMRGPSFDPVAYVDGLENPTENFPNICGWLVQHGYTDAEIKAVLGGNIYRVLQSIWIA